jgi:hypothetical protein
LEFWPRHIKIENQESILKKVANGALSPVARVAEGKGSISVEDWGPREISLQADLQTDCAVHVNQLYYPGWVAEIGRGGTLADARPSEPDGLLSFRLPAGSHQVSVRLERSWPEILGRTISAVFAGILLIQLARDYRKWRAKSSRRSAKPGEMF